MCRRQLFPFEKVSLVFSLDKLDFFVVCMLFLAVENKMASPSKATTKPDGDNNEQEEQGNDGEEEDEQDDEIEEADKRAENSSSVHEFKQYRGKVLAACDCNTPLGIFFVFPCSFCYAFLCNYPLLRLIVHETFSKLGWIEVGKDSGLWYIGTSLSVTLVCFNFLFVVLQEPPLA